MYDSALDWLCNAEKFFYDESHTTASHIFSQWFSAAASFFLIVKGHFGFQLQKLWSVIRCQMRGGCSLFCWNLSSVRCSAVLHQPS